MALNYGIKVSKPGYDVLTCADKDLIMSSKINTLKLKAVGSTSSTYAHSLAYVPLFFAASQYTSTKWGIVGQFSSAVPYTDSTNFNADGVTTKYYVFYHGAT